MKIFFDPHTFSQKAGYLGSGLCAADDLSKVFLELPDGFLQVTQSSLGVSD
jgi:hypothetical protein